MCDSLEGYDWLYRGVPAESDEVGHVDDFGEVLPPRRDRVGEEWRHRHSAGWTETAYTSWSTDRAFAVDAAHESCAGGELSGQIRILKVRIETLDMERVFEGRADEDEYLIEGTVANVAFSDDETDEES